MPKEHEFKILNYLQENKENFNYNYYITFLETKKLDNYQLSPNEHIEIIKISDNYTNFITFLYHTEEIASIFHTTIISDYIRQCSLCNEIYLHYSKRDDIDNPIKEIKKIKNDIVNYIKNTTNEQTKYLIKDYITKLIIENNDLIRKNCTSTINIANSTKAKIGNSKISSSTPIKINNQKSSYQFLGYSYEDCYINNKKAPIYPINKKLIKEEEIFSMDDFKNDNNSTEETYEINKREIPETQNYYNFRKLKLGNNTTKVLQNYNSQDNTTKKNISKKNEEFILSKSLPDRYSKNLERTNKDNHR